MGIDHLMAAWEGQFSHGGDNTSGSVVVKAYTALPEHTVTTFEKNNMLARSVHMAFYDHHPLEISPDAVWTTILQGFSNHVAMNPETLRDKVVRFKDGKKTLTVNRLHAMSDNELDWKGIIEEFADQMATEVGEELRSTVTASFSTSGPVETIVSKIAFMDSMQSYFTYVVCCGCGIPNITLLGTLEDWQEIRRRAEVLMQYELDWWFIELLPVLDEFVLAAQGQPNRMFWKSICNIMGSSGNRSPITGWIQALFPYLRNGKERANYLDSEDEVVPFGGVVSSHHHHLPPLVRNRYMNAWRQSIENNAVDDLSKGFMRGSGCGYGIELKKIPSGISSAPLKLLDLDLDFLQNKKDGDKPRKMKLCGGLTCITQNPETGALRARCGWAVLEQEVTEEK